MAFICKFVFPGHDHAPNTQVFLKKKKKKTEGCHKTGIITVRELKCHFFSVLAQELPRPHVQSLKAEMNCGEGVPNVMSTFTQILHLPSPTPTLRTVGTERKFLNAWIFQAWHNPTTDGYQQTIRNRRKANCHFFFWLWNYTTQKL